MPLVFQVFGHKPKYWISVDHQCLNISSRDSICRISVADITAAHSVVVVL